MRSIEVVNRRRTFYLKTQARAEVPPSATAKDDNLQLVLLQRRGERSSARRTNICALGVDNADELLGGFRTRSRSMSRTRRLLRR